MLPFNPSHYPRTYQPSVAKRILILASGIIVLVFGGALSYFSWVLWARHQDTTSAVGIAMLGLPALLVGAKLILEAARTKFILLPDSIENHGSLFNRTLYRDEIEGYTRTLAENTPAIEFWPKRNLIDLKPRKLRMIRIFMTFSPDEEFKAWLSGLRNLDEEESKSDVYIYSSPLSPEALAAPNSKKWFPQGLIVFPTVAALLIYSTIAARAPGALAWIDQFVTPLVNSLRFVGLGITKPFMDGPLPESYYSNMVGIGVWGVLAYNAVSIWWMVNGKGFKTVDTKAILQRLKVQYGLVGAWFALPVFLVFYLLLAMYCTFVLLNGINGWVVFHVKDFIVPTFSIMAFLFPGAFITGLWLAPLRAIVLALENRLRL